MSAFIVGNNHITKLINFAASQHVRFHFDSDSNQRVYDPSTIEDAQYLCELLARENIRSVLGRYPQDIAAEYPIDIQYKLRPFALPISPLVAIKTCRCYDYQACETADYYTTDAHRAIRWIESAAISALPGYDDADGWELK